MKRQKMWFALSSFTVFHEALIVFRGRCLDGKFFIGKQQSLQKKFQVEILKLLPAW